MTDHTLGSAVDDSQDSAGESDRPTAGFDIQRWERIGSAALGGTLLLAGLRRRTWGGAVLVLAGVWLAFRGLSGQTRLDDVLGAGSGSERVQQTTGEPLRVGRSITIDESADELTERLRDPETLERIVGHFAEVTTVDEGRHSWTADGPLGRELSWETRLVEERPGEFVHWESVEDSGLVHDWSIAFEEGPDGHGTEVTAEVRFDPPGGTLGQTAVSMLDAAPEALVGTALDRLKSLVETGEIPTTEGRVSVRGRGDLV